MANNNRNKSRRLEDQRMFNFSLGGDHLLGNVEFDWMASFAKASEERLNERYLEYESEYMVNFNNNQDKPNYSPVNAANSDVSIFTLNELLEENQYTEEEDFNFFVNAKLPVSIVEDRDGFLKFGVKTRLKNKNRDTGVRTRDLLRVKQTS